MRIMNRVSPWFLSMGLLFAAGCGSDTPKERAFEVVTVTGKVLMGSQPLAGAAVVFTPTQQTKGTGGYGVTDEDGEFSADVSPEKKGIEPGTYVVTLTKWVQKDGSPIPEGKTAADVEARQIIPDVSSGPNHESTAKVITVPKEGGNFDFQVPVAK